MVTTSVLVDHVTTHLCWWWKRVGIPIYIPLSVKKIIYYIYDIYGLAACKHCGKLVCPPSKLTLVSKPFLQ